MPRRARTQSESGIYHVMVRGINRQKIFHDEEDKNTYLDLLNKYKEICGYMIFAYCLMDNHVHLVIKEGKMKLSDVMKRIGVSYVYWYNKKYSRIGHLFQDRYRSERINDDKYLLMVMRYIHYNPVNVGGKINEWTSYNDYLRPGGLADSKYILEIMNVDMKKAQEEFKRFNNATNEDQCLEMPEEKKPTDTEAKQIIDQIVKANDNVDLRTWERQKRDKALKEIKMAGLTIRQIERITGINRGIILKA